MVLKALKLDFTKQTILVSIKMKLNVTFNKISKIKIIVPRLMKFTSKIFLRTIFVFM